MHGAKHIKIVFVDVTRVCQPMETISSTFFQYIEQNPDINCKRSNHNSCSPTHGKPEQPRQVPTTSLMVGYTRRAFT